MAAENVTIRKPTCEAEFPQRFLTSIDANRQQW